MLELGRDPAAEKYAADVTRVHKELHGIDIKFDLKTRWIVDGPSERLSPNITQQVMQELSAVVTRRIARSLVKSALNGFWSPRSVDGLVRYDVHCTVRGPEVNITCVQPPKRQSVAVLEGALT